MISLEIFPDSVLEVIFENSSTQDLLRMCCISKDFYHPATTCLYRRISVPCTFSEMSELDEFSWLSDKYTETYDLRVLSRTLKANPVLAGKVKSLSVTEDNSDTKASLFISCPNLIEYHNTGYVKKSYFSKTPRISCRVTCLPTFDKNLTELRLQFVSHRGERERFSKIADSMTRDNVHENLRILALEHTEPEMYGGSQNLCDIDEEELEQIGNAPWIYFFFRFISMKTVMNLTSLGLQGLVSSPQTVFNFIALAVNLENLETLEMAISETSHNDETHDERWLRPTFLKLFATSIAKVVNLHVSYSSACAHCEFEDVMQLLMLIKKDQLRTLSIQLFVPFGDTVMRLHGTIMHRQQNLVSLRYSDERPPCYPDSDDSSDDYSCDDGSDGERSDGDSDLGSSDDESNDDFDDKSENSENSGDDATSPLRRSDVFRICLQQQNYELIKHHFTPEFVFSKISPMKTSKENQDMLVNRAAVIQHILDGDIMYVLGRQKMPHLVEYRRHGLCVNVKKDVFVANGQEYDWSHLKNDLRRRITLDLLRLHYADPSVERN